MALNRRPSPIAIAVVALSLLAGAGQPTNAQTQAERMVLAFYYAWFDANTWSSGTLSDLPLTRYNSDDREVMARHVEQAQQAGIDAFVFNWWGKGNRTETNLEALLQVAGQKGFRVAVDFDLNSPVMQGVESYLANLRHLSAVHTVQPAYLRVDGRPVVFFYNITRLSVTTWRALRDQVDPEHKALWIAEGTDVSYLSVFDGLHLYSITWPNRIPPSATLSKWGNRVREYAGTHNAAKLWVATVMPGYDDRGVRPNGGFIRSRDGGTTTAVAGRPPSTAARTGWSSIPSTNGLRVPTLNPARLTVDSIST